MDHPGNETDTSNVCVTLVKRTVSSHSAFTTVLSVTRRPPALYATILAYSNVACRILLCLDRRCGNLIGGTRNHSRRSFDDFSGL